MGIQCPQCQAINPDTKQFCGDCGTQLISAEAISNSYTKTLQTPVKDLIKGTIFAGRYQLIEELGRGGMGVVYKAEDTKLKRTVALKFLPSELTHIPDVKERFMREAQSATALDHPNICTVHKFDEAEQKSYISMAYIEGQSLKKKIESGPLELDPLNPLYHALYGVVLVYNRRFDDALAAAPHRVGYGPTRGLPAPHWCGVSSRKGCTTSCLPIIGRDSPTIPSLLQH